MDRRVFFAVILTALVIVITPMLFPSTAPSIGKDSTSAMIDSATTSPQRRDTAAAATAAKMNSVAKDTATGTEARTTTGTTVAVGDTLTLAAQNATDWFASSGGSVLGSELDDFLSERRGHSQKHVVLESGGRTRLVWYEATLGSTPLDLSTTDFSGKVDSSGPNRTLVLTGTASGHPVTISYATQDNDVSRYLVRVRVEFPDLKSDGTLIVHLPSTLTSAETDTVDDLRHLAFAYRPKHDDVANVMFAKLDSGNTKSIAGPLEWAGVRNKYFLVAVIAPDSTLGPMTLTGGPRIDKIAATAYGSVAIPIRNGATGFELYLGPQEYDRLKSLGHELDQVNQYNSFLHAVVQPFASIMTRILLWMKRTSGLGYGWVIIIFGVAVRLLLWPLNQSAMRTTIRMQRLQPELTEVQKKYKNDPRKQQEALVKLYQAHGMTPFSPMMGCLPMMLPMPILFALYFVFLNTIEFRGVSFLWMHDISAADPYYIIPLIMGLSMFALSWIGMRGTPPTPQTRMMSYMMPVLFTFMFFRFAAGLNLYYAVQNLAALPQQWMLSNERASLNATKPATERRQNE